MRNKWLIGAVVFGALMAVGYGAWRWWSDPWVRFETIKRVASGRITEGQMPLELGENFDPTVSQSTFMLLGKKEEGNVLRVKWVFPPVMGEREVETALGCEGGIRARGRDERVGRRVTAPEARKLMTEENGPVLVTGLCSDAGCSQIVGACDIYLSGKTK